MLDRREFLKSSFIYSLSLTTIPVVDEKITQNHHSRNRPSYKLSLNSPTQLFNENNCWANPISGILPTVGRKATPHVLLTMNLADLSGTDCYRQMSGMHSGDLGKSWSEPYKIRSLSPRQEIIDNIERPIAVTGFWPKYHSKSKKMLGIGHTVAYTQDWKVKNPRPRHTAFSIFDAELEKWIPWQKMEMPGFEKFFNSGAGGTQRFDQSDGSILLPFYFSPPGQNARVAVAKCNFDGKMLRFSDYGNELAVNDSSRGLHEPSITLFNGTYFLTIRNDVTGYVTYSKDGLNFAPIRTWKFDDGESLGNYNTQQHWVTHSEGLFLVYTRRGAKNDHIFRHRAPLFMAEVDPDTLCVIRETERVLVPERGARLGNFGVTDISPNETWVTVAEYMKPKGIERHGSDGSVFIAKIHWDRPNKLLS